MTREHKLFQPETTVNGDRLAFVLQAAGIGTWDLDPVNQLVRLDDRCKELYGFSQKDWVTYEQMLLYIHPDDQQRVRQAVQWALTPQSGGQYDIQFRTLGAEDHQVRWIYCKGQAFFDGQGVPYRFSGIAQPNTLAMSGQQVQQQTTSQQTEIERQLADQLHFSIEAADLATWDLNPATNQFSGNDRLKNWFGLSPQADIDLSVALNVILKKDRQRVIEAIQTSLQFASGGQYDIDYTIVHPLTKQERIVRAKGRAWFSENNLAYRFNGTLQDITDQKKAEQTLMESEARFRSLVEQASVATCLFVGRELRVDVVNDIMLSHWGKGSLVAGKRLVDILPELKGQPFLNLLDDVFTTGIPYEAKAARAELTIDGVRKVHYFDFTYKPLRNTQGDVYAVMAMSIDVTEQVIARQQVEITQTDLLQTNQRLSLALDAGRLGSYELELATGLMDCTLQCKLNFGQLTDTPFNFADLMQAIVDEDRPRVQQAVNQAIDTHGIYYCEYRIIWPNGELHWVKASGQVVYSADNQPLRIIGVTQDMTAQRMAQEDLERQVQQRTLQLQASIHDLKRSNDNLQQFAYIASHDLQEPLRKIQSFGDILKTQYSAQLGAGMDHLQRMQSAASRMSALIKDLLTFSRISTQQEATTSVSLKKALNSVLSDLELTIQETGAVIDVDPLPTVPGDTSQVGQLFQNLLTNALKFRRADTIPRIRISCQIITVMNLPHSVRPTRMAAEYYCIDVSDNGIGFDEKYVDRIFQVFQRLHGKNEFVGTGVGLAICEKVAANHGGAITATSQPGQGATFSVYLPVADNTN